MDNNNVLEQVQVLSEYMKKVLTSDNSLGHDRSTALTITVDSTFGRQLIAARDVPEGEILFCERPLIIVPQGGCGPTCLSCLRVLEGDFHSSCERCGAPMCQTPCTLSRVKASVNSSHSETECEVLERLKEVPWQSTRVPVINAALTPLRTYLRMQSDADVRPVILSMQSNAEKRKSMSIGAFIESVICPLIRTRLNTDVSSELIHHSCGIFDTNAFKFSTEDKRQGRALLPLTGLMTHSCCPNTDHWFTSEGDCVVRSSTAINAGTPITTSYTNCFLPTSIRLKHLLATKLFVCRCERCLDPTEFNTLIGSIKCRQCGDSLLESGGAVPKWQCIACKATLPNDQATLLTRAAISLAENADLETLPQLFKMVGKQNYTVIMLLTSYVRRNMENNTEELSDEELQNTVSAALTVLPTASTLYPGLTLCRGELVMAALKCRLLLRRRGVDCCKYEDFLTGQKNKLDSTVLLDLCCAIYKDHPLQEIIEKLQNEMRSSPVDAPT